MFLFQLIGETDSPWHTNPASKPPHKPKASPSRKHRHHHNHPPRNGDLEASDIVWNASAASSSSPNSPLWTKKPTHATPVIYTQRDVRITHVNFQLLVGYQ